MIKKFLLTFLILLPLNSFALEKKTTFNEELFKKAQSDGKLVLVSSWIEYCYSCASQMKVLDKAEKEFENVKYFAFDVTNKEISSLFNVQYQSTILIFKDNKEVHRSIGVTNKEEIYKIIKSYI
tara:strand:+ start:154 stop:525 length:372 start_codon:yes stop_codon:yes gene_type:complete